MDIIYRLRVIFWFLIVIIWGIYLYQYIHEDINTTSEKNKIIINKKTTEQKIIIEKKNDEYYEQPQQKIVITSQITNAKKEKQDQRILISKKDDISLPEEHYKEERTEESISFEKKLKIKIPDGFEFKETRHFYLYVEKGIKIEEIEREIELLHGEIMLDLIAFSPWTRDSKVHIYLTLTPQKYHELSGRPIWSGGAANLKDRKIYLYKSDEWYGILAHELTHIYFDSFFGSYDRSPLWLSEGVAVYIQVERAKAYPSWLKENLKYLQNDMGYRLEDLARIKSLEDASDKSVKLWYAQSYSLVKLLIKIQRGDSFYQFCKRIKEGDTISQALFKAYGKPYTNLKALEYVWKAEIKKMQLPEDI